MTRAVALLIATTLAGCISRPQVPEPARYDLGIPAAANRLIQTADADAPYLRTRVHARSWLDDTSMHYRLHYADELQAHAYAYARWAAPPAEMLAQRLRHRLASAAQPTPTGASALLDLELEEFVQVFESPSRSLGRVTFHAQLFDGSTRHATFSEEAVASSPDAPGGARALAEASDALIARLVDWIGGRQRSTTSGGGQPRPTSIDEMLEAHWLRTARSSSMRMTNALHARRIPREGARE